MRFAEEGELRDGAVLFGPAGEQGDEVAVGRGEGGEVAEEGVACGWVVRWEVDYWGVVVDMCLWDRGLFSSV